MLICNNLPVKNSLWYIIPRRSKQCMFFILGLSHYGVVRHPCPLKCPSYLGILVNLGHLLVDIHSRSSEFGFDQSRPLALQGHPTVSSPTPWGAQYLLLILGSVPHLLLIDHFWWPRINVIQRLVEWVGEWVCHFEHDLLVRLVSDLVVSDWRPSQGSGVASALTRNSIWCEPSMGLVWKNPPWRRMER